MDIYQKQFLDKASAQAEQSEHVYPVMAACEAALESGYGTSSLAIRDNNLFGMKQHEHPVFGTEVLPTREFLHGSWTVVNAEWIVYPTLADCFSDRMSTLRRLSSEYPNYADALAATDAISYVTAVSKTWSTDPDRADKVIEIYSSYNGR